MGLRCRTPGKVVSTGPASASRGRLITSFAVSCVRRCAGSVPRICRVAQDHVRVDVVVAIPVEVINTVKSFGIQPKRTSFRSPWQNGVAEGWVSSCRRDLLDHVIVLNERHLKRLMSEYVRYYHEDRTHLALEKGTPGSREAVQISDATRKVISMPRLGGLHHRYDVAA
jgi:transposase InsO family protein